MQRTVQSVKDMANIITGAMSVTTSILIAALDEVECGLILLDSEFQAQFINRAFHKIWALPELSNGSTYNFADIVEHGRRTGL